jgi:hypothetical protein
MDNYALMFLPCEPLHNVLPELLKDQTTGKNIVWATDTYSEYGTHYHKDRQMFPDFQLNLIYDGLMLPRVQKSIAQQKSRTKSKAEVFTPSWICNKMNNYCDADWFGRADVFNREVDANHTWCVVVDKIEFNKPNDWKKYVDSKRLEITCGEAPYLVSRYDTTTGKDIPIKERIGILDRKLRVVNENTDTEEDWLEWTTRAFQSVYGFEYQGDNLFFARVNLMMTFIEYYQDRFGKQPTAKDIKKIAEIISWNLWQMDGLKDTVPFGIPDDDFKQMSLSDETTDKDKPVYSKIQDWRSSKDRIIEYRTMKGEN